MFDPLGDRIEELSSRCRMLPLQGRLWGTAKACDQSVALDRNFIYSLAFSPLESDRGDNYHPNFTILKKITKLAFQLENRVCGTVFMPDLFLRAR